MSRSWTRIALLATVIGLACAENAAAALPQLRVPVIAQPSMKGRVDESWAHAAAISLAYDFTYRRQAAPPLIAYVAQDGGGLDVAFQISDRRAPVAVQRANGSSVLSDDYVGVYLAPLGSQGIDYGFFANPNGARYQTSTENSLYSPSWSVASGRTEGGYVVTMRIPFAILRSGSSETWKAQFVVSGAANGSLAVWSFSPQAGLVSDPTYFGALGGIAPASTNRKAARGLPRIQVYGLGQAASASYGGTAFRFGADLSLPIASNSSFVAALHPDYSNVEIDQQTINPTAFTRQYTEVRPLFTQGSSYYNNNVCTNCPVTLYTPSIGAFSQGYAVEGTQGHFGFAAFDAIGSQRTDQAQTLDYTYKDSARSIGAYFQRVEANEPGVSDVATTLDLSYTNQHSHFFLYSNNGMDRGSLVSDTKQGNYFEDGFGYSDASSYYVLAYQRVGRYFEPYDGYVAQSDIAGYLLSLQKVETFSAKAWVHDANAVIFAGRYVDHLGNLSQIDALEQLNLDLKNLFVFRVTASALGVRTQGGEFLPFDGNSVTLGYHMSTDTQSGNSGTLVGNAPTYVQYTGGPYYHGELDAWSYVATLPIATRIHIGVEADEDRYGTKYSGEETTAQWLERASLDFQMSHDAQLDIGVRRLIGANLPVFYAPLTESASGACLTNPYLPGCVLDATNVSIAFHFLASHNEFYLAYGMPNSLATTPAVLLKWIRYIGAEKGT